MIRNFTTIFFLLFVISVNGQLLQRDIPLILEQNQKKFGLSALDIQSYEIADSYLNKQLNIQHIYLVQKDKDIKVFNGILNLNLQNGKIVSFGNRWTPNLSSHVPNNAPAINAVSAIKKSAEHLGATMPNPDLLSVEKNKFQQETKFVFEDQSLSREEIRVELFWLQDNDASIRLCWVINIYELHEENIWNIFIDAHTGEFIKKHNQVIECSFDRSHHHNNHIQHPSTLDHFSTSVSTDSAYTVFPLTIESPNHGDRMTVVTPWHAAGTGHPATTLNWHDNGTTNYTSTRGNNVHAYEDINNSNSPGYSPDTANLQFDYPFDPNLPPAENQAAAITNLFYWNNIIHDIMYIYGFDEVSGNFQTDNLGRGGIGGDYVRAEGLDGGGLNNANFSTPADGFRPRMQMYLWSGVSGSTPLTINTPESIAGDMYAVESAFSSNNKLSDIGLTTGDLVLVLDVGDDTHLACGELTNEDSLSGKIALIDRGDCNFTVKVKKAQDLGAIAAIVINNTTGNPIAMGGTDSTIVIPAVMISLANGNNLKDILIEEDVNASLDEIPEVINLDGDYDNGIITHEYGHGISIRLTGGPSAVNCLYNEEQMGEGWSDFFGLMLTTDWSAAESTDRRGIGTYVLSEPTDGDGIRTYPYTTDMEINPFTYADVADAPGSSSSPSPHFVGSIWSTILWDMTWAIIEVAGMDTDIYHGTGGNNIALSLVMNGLKLQPCNPGFVDGRDAILLADELLYNGQYKCAIWNAFARRGLGVSASQGSSDNYEDGVEAFDTPDGISIESTPSFSLASEGQEVTFTIKTICGCTAKSNLLIKEQLSADLTYIPGSGGTLNGNIVEFTADTLLLNDTLEFSYRAFVAACSATDTIELSEDDAEGPDLYISVQLAGLSTKEWIKNSTQFESPSNSWYAEDYTSLSDFALTLETEVDASGLIEISFNHRYETEEGYDGGVVEYSYDDGTTWIDAGPNFIQNGYPEIIHSGDSENPIAGREAFTGNSDTQFNTIGFLQSKIRLCSDINQSLKLRFRFAADGGVGGPGINGWYIDDIFIKQISGVVNKSFVSELNTLLDSTTYCLRTAPFTSSTIYVDQSAGGAMNGTNWMGAMRYLLIALDVAQCREVDSVFVAEGIYIPNLEDDRQHGFSLPDSVSIYGGFPSGGSSFVLRDPLSHVAILSGDIGALNDTSDNVFHLIKIGSDHSEILIDGVTLTHANASGEGDNGKGAAIFCEGGLTLERVIMQANYGKLNGQIIFNQGESAQLVLKNCLIYTPNGTIIPLLNESAGQVSIDGTTQFVKE